MARRVVLIILAALLAGYAAGKVAARLREPEEAALAAAGAGTKLVDTRSGRTHVLDVGEGDVVLLLHGSGRSVADWQQGLAARLAERLRVVAFDAYGFGRSERNHPWRYGPALWSEQAVDVLDALGIERAVVMGHSAGGVVAAFLAADHPERVRGVVFTGHGLAMDPVQLLPFLPGVGELVLGLSDAFGCEGAEPYCAEVRAAFRIRGTRAAFLTFVRRQYTIDGLRLLRGTYEEIRAPVLQVHGEADASIPVAAARRLTGRLSQGRLVVVDGAPHDLHLAVPERLAGEIAAFAGALPSEAP
jgi:2-hydroxymuconate-semialdehyde hydrolase